MNPLLDVNKIKAIAISKIWLHRYRLPIGTSARLKLTNSICNLKIIVHYFDRYYQDSIPEDREILFKVAYSYFPKKIPFWVLFGRRLNLRLGSTIDY